MYDKKWEDWLREQVKKKKVTVEVKEKINLKKYVSTIRGLITTEIIIGLAAVFLMYYEFGLDRLIETLLNMVISITILTTLVVGFIKRYGKMG